MKHQPFRSGRVDPGDRLVLAWDETVEFEFRGMGHFGSVIARRLVPVPGKPRDVIGRQKDFLVAEKPGP